MSLVVAASCLLADCVSQPTDDQPLGASMIHSRFSGRTFNGLQHGNGFLLHLEPNGIASVNGPTAEYGRWRTTEEGLCLKWHEGPETCAPVYQIGFARYRVGDAEMDSQETFPLDRGFERGFGGRDFEHRWDRPAFGP
ncbi:MAG: hypothetical protein JWL84_4713 [Rhodospirillales bacterium]|nr:hypothetical protein [Rhodospirillales bacterium]